MSLHRLLFAIVLAGFLALPTAIPACPVCSRGTGEAVRAGIFNEDFGPNLLMTILPFPLMLGIAAALHFGFGARDGATDARRSRESLSPTESF